jgi:hypothetical protein
LNTTAPSAASASLNRTPPEQAMSHASLKRTRQTLSFGPLIRATMRIGSSFGRRSSEDRLRPHGAQNQATRIVERRNEGHY